MEHLCSAWPPSCDFGRPVGGAGRHGIHLIRDPAGAVFAATIAASGTCPGGSVRKTRATCRAVGSAS